MSSKDINFDYSGLKAYSGYFKDNNELLSCSSGGAATAISKLIIKKGGIVYGVGYSDDFYQAEYKLAETIEQLDQFKGSKYVEVTKKIRVGDTYESVYSHVIKSLTSDKLVLFIGLGCDVSALIMMCKSKNINIKNLYTVNLICHGPTYKEVHTQYLEFLEKKYNSKIINFTVRFKKDKWQPIYLHAEFKNGKVYEVPFYDPYECDYGNAFRIYLKKSCYNCHFKGPNHKSDITVGDYWGIKQEMPGYNKNGVSILFTRTPKGEELLSELSYVGFEVFSADIENALLNNKRYYTCVKKDEYYDKFETDLKEKGLHYAVTRWVGVDKIIINKTKRFIKRMLTHLEIHR